MPGVLRRARRGALLMLAGLLAGLLSWSGPLAPALAEDPAPPQISDWLAEESGGIQMGLDGVARLIFAPEYREAPALAERLAAHKLGGLVVRPIPPLVARLPGADKKPRPPILSRLLLLAPSTHTLEHARRILRQLDAPPRSAFVSILASEVRRFSHRESGGSLLYDHGLGTDPSNTFFRSYVTTFEPDAYLRSALTGVTPFEGTTLTFNDMDAGSGALTYALRALSKCGCAEFLAWPNLVVTEGAPPATMQSLRVLPQEILENTANPTLLYVKEEVGLKLRLTPVQIGLDSAVLDLDVWLRIPEVVDDSTTLVGSLRLKKRQVRTRVTLRDREPLMLGGLVLHRCEHRRGGLPRPNYLSVLDPLHSSLFDKGRDTEIVFLIRMRSAGPGRTPAEMRPGVYRGWAQGGTKTDPFGRARARTR